MVETLVFPMPCSYTLRGHTPIVGISDSVFRAPNVLAFKPTSGRKPFELSRCAPRARRPTSRIVLLASIAGSVGNPGYGTYSANKTEVRSYARSWSKELAGRGIRVNTVSPGPIDTPMFDNVSDEVRRALTDQIPMNRMGLPE